MNAVDMNKMHGIDEKQARKILMEKFTGLSPYYLSYFSWPQVFSNTAGPFVKEGMLVGQAFTTFQMECWTDQYYALIFCKGRVVNVIDCDEPFTVEWYASQRRYAQ